MKLLLITALTCLFQYGQLLASGNCTTRFLLKDCEGQVVPGVTVIIQSCKNNETTGAITDASGVATFKVCLDDICKVSFTFVGYATMEGTKKTMKEKCKKEGKNATCEYTLCDDIRDLDQ